MATLTVPSRKVGAGAVIGIPVGIVLVWLLSTYGGAQIPDVVSAAIGSICSFVASYFVRDTEEAPDEQA